MDVLKHLALAGGQRSHPNVLKYVDSWEQDDVLYIQTELCELGNFGTFLAEYGMHFEALDEARVWKICAELSNVGSLHYVLLIIFTNHFHSGTKIHTCGGRDSPRPEACQHFCHGRGQVQDWRLWDGILVAPMHRR